MNDTRRIDDQLITSWASRIALTGLIWLGVKAYFVLVAIPFSWLVALAVAMFLVGTTRFAVWRLK